MARDDLASGGKGGKDDRHPSGQGLLYDSRLECGLPSSLVVALKGLSSRYVRNLSEALWDVIRR